LSLCLKRGKLGAYDVFAVNGNDYLIFNASDQLVLVESGGMRITTTAVFRDPSAHYHIVLNLSGTAFTLYVNNQSVGTGTASGAATQFNTNAKNHAFGAFTGTGYMDGYLSDVYFIDGQALTPSSFGETNSDGVWVPKTYSGTYGTNGFHLDFKDAAVTAGSNAGLGKDVSGNANYWTTSAGISVSAGVTYDSMVDTPTNNYATLNPLNAYPAFVNSGALRLTSAGANWFASGSTIAVSSGKWYWEVTAGTTSGSGNAIGIEPSTQNLLPATTYVGLSANGYGYYSFNGNMYHGGASTGYGASWASANVIGVALDMDAGTITFYKNGVSQGQMASGLTGAYQAALSVYDSGNYLDINFGQRPFTYSNYGTDRPASTFKALCTANLPAVSITKPALHFDVKNHTGIGASDQSVTGVSFKPDFAWIKSRNFAVSNGLTDSVRGAYGSGGGILFSDTIGAESVGGSWVRTFDADGFTLTGGSSGNASTYTYVDWLWKAGGAPTTDNVAGAGNTPTAGSVKVDGTDLGSALAGSIAATRLSANTTAGFSIVTYTGTGVNATVGHGLGVAPKMIILKERNSATSWLIAHDAASFNWANDYYQFDTSAKHTDGAGVAFRIAPTTTTFGLGTAGSMNGNTDTYVAYCFAEIPGYSKFGSYVGNGSADGVFVFTGFQPRYVLVKSSTAVDDWRIYDLTRPGYNVQGGTLLADTAGAETTTAELDLLSNGFKARITTTPNAAQTYIYAAFAAYPFGGQNVSPAPAR
jgi:hypothetical protein